MTEFSKEIEVDVDLNWQPPISPALARAVSDAVRAERERCISVVLSHPMRFAGEDEDTVRRKLASAIEEQ